MLIRFNVSRKQTIHQIIAASCSSALVALCACSANPAHAAYSYSPPASLSEGGIKIAFKDATISGDRSDTLLFNGNPVTIDNIWRTLEDRRLRLDRMISENIMQGNLKTNQAVALRKELEMAAEDLYKFTNSDMLTNARVISIANQLDAVSMRLTNTLAVKPMPRLVVLDDTTGKVALMTDFFGEPLEREFAVVVQDRPQDDLLKQRASIEERIRTELDSGNLSVSEAAGLRAMLIDLSVTEKAMRQSDGKLEPVERQQVKSELDKVVAALEASVSM